MKFHVPFTISPIEKLKKRAFYLKKKIHYKKNSKLQNYLASADIGITREEYLAICYHRLIFSFFSSLILFSVIFFVLKIPLIYKIIFPILAAIFLSSFIFTLQLMYPKLYAARRQRNIEKNLIPSLEDILIQLNSGIPLFSIFVNIASYDYGELSAEFKKAVKKINAGLPQIEVFEELGDINSSPLFKRTLWQLSNGMKAGSDISNVIKDSIRSLTEEQLLQIQNYGNKLNPIIMFYMLVSVILPALAITFFTVISSLISLPTITSILLYISLFVMVVFFQIMFLGIIRSIRPSLL